MRCCVLFANNQTLITLFRQGRATSRAMLSSDSLNLTLMSDDDAPNNNAGSQTRAPFVARLLQRRRSRTTQFGHLEDRFVRIACRVAAYPIALVIVNGVIASKFIWSGVF